jgi:hypothetical protein
MKHGEALLPGDNEYEKSLKKWSVFVNLLAQYSRLHILSANCRVFPCVEYVLESGVLILESTFNETDKHDDRRSRALTL